MAAKGDVRRRLRMDHVKTNQMDHRNCVRTRERAGKKTDRKMRFSKPADAECTILAQSHGGRIDEGGTDNNIKAMVPQFFSRM